MYYAVVPVVTPERLQHRGIIGKDRLAAIELVLIEEHDRIARKLLQNELSMKTLVDSTIKDIATANHKPICAAHQSCLKSLKNLLKRCGLLSRPIKDTRLMIMLSCIQALQDIGFVLLTLFILFTLVRTVPLIRDLWSVGSCNPMKYKTKLILIKHAMALANDLKSIAGFLCCTIIIVAFVGGIPSFLRDLPSHIDTYDQAFRIAAKHANRSIINFCEVLVLITAFRTYRIVFRSAMYCLIIPGACLAEACPLICLSAIQRFIFGLLTWFGLLVGAIIVAIRTDSDQSSASRIRISLLAIGGAMFGVLLLSAVTVSTRRIYTQPDSRAVSSLKFTWNHILALITGPLESIQLSAVIMYFFWNYSSNRSSDALGTDSLSAVLMVWGYQGDSNAQQTHSLYYYDSGDRDALDISILVASIAVFVWAIVISIPLVWSSGAEREQQWNAGNLVRNRDKVIKFKGSALVEFFTVLLSRILCVWIMATLMRTTSCVDKEVMIPSFDDDGGGGGVTTVEVATAVVVSTSQRVNCSNNHWWAAHSSLALLLFYMITSSILNADEADLLRENYRGGGGVGVGGVKSKEASVVKFAPLYALCIRAAQFFVCIACFGGFEAQSVYIPLIPVLFISLLITIIPQAVMVTCSVVAVGSLRTAGFACVCWTTVVCIIRGAGETSSIWSTESCIYVGWGVIYAIAIIIAVYEEYEVTRRWRELLEQSGLLASIEALVGFLSDRSTLEVLSEQSLHYTFANNTRGLQKYVTVVNGHSGGGDGMKNKHFVNYYIKRVQQSTRSVKDIATFLILLEEVTYHS